MMEAWRPLSANATVYGLVMLVAYMTAAALCAVAARRCSDHPRHRRGGTRIATMPRERLLWQALAALLAILAFYRQFDLAELVTGLGRTIAVDGDWYGSRRPLQRTGIGLIAIAVGVGSAVIFRRVAGVSRLALTALAACTVLVLLLGVNVVSLHRMDTLLRWGYHRVTIYNLTESGCLATILAATLAYRHQAMAVISADRAKPSG